MKKLFSILLVLALILGLSACGDNTATEEKTVDVLSWVGYIDDDTLAQFEKDTGIKVTWTAMDSIDDMLLKLENGDSSQYDIILSSDYSLGILREEGLLEKLDRSKLTNWNNLNPNYLGQFYDPADEYVVPYISGYTMLVYDEDMVSAPITSYEDLWRSDLENNICLLYNPRVICGMTAKTLGMSMNETDKAKIESIREKLIQLRANVATANDDSGYTYMATGNAAVGFMYMPFAYMANAERETAGLKPLKVVYPSEGMGFGIDGFVIAKGSKHYDNALTLLNWLMQPEIAAHNAETQMYGCVNSAAEAFLSDEYKNSPIINLPASVVADAEMIRNLDIETETLYNEVYTEFLNN